MKAARPGVERPSETLHPAARLIAVEDLPVARTEIELSSPPNKLVLAEPSTRTRKILALVRLHTHPLGIVVLEGGADRRWTTHASTVWSAMRGQINDHLAADGLPELMIRSCFPPQRILSARCVQRRQRSAGRSTAYHCCGRHPRASRQFAHLPVRAAGPGVSAL